MSTSPSKYQPQPPPASQVRSQAIAKLKRAASLPRTPDGRRAVPPRGLTSAVTDNVTPPGGTDSGADRAHSPHKHMNQYGDEELLSPTPGSGLSTSLGMQRTPSSESPSYQGSTTPQITYPSASPSPYYSAQPSPVSGANTDWAAYQLAQSYLPTINPVSPAAFQGNAPPSSFPSNLHGVGRNTPSPLPTLGELRNLSRSNSAAARAKAMDKLTGGHPSAAASSRVNILTTPTHSDEDVHLGMGGSLSLARAGTIGAPRMFGMQADQHVDDIVVAPPAPDPDTAFGESRPRLQRSFTVSSSNMAEERRSVVGRRMVERLAERRAARQQDEVEVRALWQEKRAAHLSRLTLGTESVDTNDSAEQTDTYSAGTSIESKSDMDDTLSSIRQPQNRELQGSQGLAVTDRTTSRNTERSDEAFEYEAHLRRSLSGRTARALEISEAPAELALPSPVPESSAETGVGYVGGTFLRQLEVEAPQQETFSAMKARNSPAQHPIVRETLLPEQDASKGSFDPVEEEADDWRTRDSSQAYAASQEDTSFYEAYRGYGDFDSQEKFTPSSSVPVSIPGSAADSRVPSGISWDSSNGSDKASPIAPPPGHKKSNSIGARMGRTLAALSRKHSSRGSSRMTSPSRSPRDTLTNASQELRRNASQLSTAASYRSATRNSEAEQNRQGAAVQSPPLLSPALSTTDDANSYLIQHQLSSASTPVSFLPRANLNDPRIHNSKLSPFPGIASFDGQPHGPEHSRPVHHKLTGSNGSARMMSPSNGQAGDYGRELPSNGPNKPSMHHQRDSDGSVSHGSYSDCNSAYSRGNGEDHRASPVDPFGPDPSTPKAGTLAHGRMRSRAGEVADFMSNRRRAPPPPIEVTASNADTISDSAHNGKAHIAPEQRGILQKMDDLLSLPANDPARPDFLDDPPRKLLLAQQVFQVVNSRTVKDRYLFLFNDILVITKPIITDGVTANLDMKFIVKSVVSLGKLGVSGISDEPTNEPSRHPVVREFIRQFADNSKSAIRWLGEQTNSAMDTVTLAALLFRTPGLDRSQLGILLATDEKLLRAFVGRFRFEKIRIDDALRVFLLSIRLPTDTSAAESLLRGFADGYWIANQDDVKYHYKLAQQLVLAILELNDMLYSTFGFAFPNHAISRDTFTSSFKAQDPEGHISDQLLGEIFSSIRAAKLVQALSPREAHLQREISVTPSGLPSKLSVNEWSEEVTVTIPRVDPSFKLKLLGEGLDFEPAVLDFSRSSQQSFHVRGAAPGHKTLLFERYGANAAQYAGIGHSRNFRVEHAFMRHTFHVAFISHNGSMRKYCFSVPDASARQRWGAMLTRQAYLTRDIEQGVGPGSIQSRVRRAAEAVALQVLRDVLIPAENKQHSARHASVSLSYPDNTVGGEPQDGTANPSLAKAQTGKELVLLCRQNSLLPDIREMLYRDESVGNRHDPVGDRGDSLGNNPQYPMVMGHTQRPVRSAGLKAIMQNRRL